MAVPKTLQHGLDDVNGPKKLDREGVVTPLGVCISPPSPLHFSLKSNLSAEEPTYCISFMIHVLPFMASLGPALKGSKVDWSLFYLNHAVGLHYSSPIIDMHHTHTHTHTWKLTLRKDTT